MSTCVMSDIHGCCGAFQAMLGKIDSTKMTDLLSRVILSTADRKICVRRGLSLFDTRLTHF